MEISDCKNSCEAGKAQVISIFGLNFLPEQRSTRKSAEEVHGKLSAEFDARGNLIGLRNLSGAATRYAYDEKSQLCEAHYPDGAFCRFKYDENGRVVEKTKRDGSRIQYEHAAEKVAAVKHADGSATRLAYDAHGRLYRVATSESMIQYDYNAQKQILRQSLFIHGRAFVTNYRYEASGALAGIMPPGSREWLSYRYDEKGNLVGVQLGRATVDKSASADGSRVRMACGNGLNTDFKFDPAGKLEQIRVARGEQVLNALNYAVTSKGLIARQNHTRYGYDASQRLAEADSGNNRQARFRYDTDGNLLSRQGDHTSFAALRHDECHRLLQYKLADDAIVCRYDANGNLIEKCGKSGKIEYGYDGFDRLIWVKQNGAMLAEYGYDGRGWRIFKRTAAGETYYHYDCRGLLIGKTVGDKSIFYLAANGALWGHVESDASGERIFYYHADHIGSVRLVTDEQGRVIQQSSFSPFGEPQGDGDIVIFAGKEWDPESGCYYFGARYYDPATCRFLTPDSFTYLPDDERLVHWPATSREIIKAKQQLLRTWLEQWRGQNNFAYCANNPINFVDANGHDFWGYLGYTILGLTWGLPHTVNAFLFFEVIVNWVFYYFLTFAWLWDKTHSWEGASSDRLTTWSWNIIGGFSGKMVIGGAAFTQGNIVIYNSDFHGGLDDTISNFIPVAYPSVNITEKAVAKEHELRHVAQFAWFGPLMMPWVLLLGFMLYYGIYSLFPISKFQEKWKDLGKHIKDHLWELAFIPLLPGAYWWDYIVKGGYSDSSFEQDAAIHSGYAVNINIPPAAPTLISPADASTATTAIPTFDWNDIPGAVSYQLQLDNDNNFSSPVIDQAGLVTSQFTPASPLTSGAYFWRVRAQNGRGSRSDWSAVRSVTIP